MLINSLLYAYLSGDFLLSPLIFYGFVVKMGKIFKLMDKQYAYVNNP